MKTVNRHVMDLIDWDSGESFEHTDPEKYLWFCVMDRAFRDIGDEEVDQEDLEKWFFDTKNMKWDRSIGFVIVLVLIVLLLEAEPNIFFRRWKKQVKLVICQ